jgi:hypothetical protein
LLAELEVGRDSRRSKVMSILVKYWFRILHMEKEDLVRMCYEWHMDNLKYESLETKLKEKEIDKLGSLCKAIMSRTCKIVKERCNNIGRKLIANTREKISLVFYCEMKVG